jgi:hypothetical protein
MKIVSNAHCRRCLAREQGRSALTMLGIVIGVAR